MKWHQAVKKNRFWAIGSRPQPRSPHKWLKSAKACFFLWGKQSSLYTSKNMGPLWMTICMLHWQDLTIVVPKWSMYGIFTYIYHKNHLNVGKYTSPMDPMGYPNRLKTHQFIPTPTCSSEYTPPPTEGTCSSWFLQFPFRTPRKIAISPCALGLKRRNVTIEASQMSLGRMIWGLDSHNHGKSLPTPKSWAPPAKFALFCWFHNMCQLIG